MKRSGSSNSVKRPLSTDSHGSLPGMKRVNSKEDGLKRVSSKDEVPDDSHEVRLSRGFGEVVIGSPKSMPKTLQKRASMRLVKNKVFEHAMRNPERLARAIEIAKLNHCAEGLLLFSHVIEWEAAESPAVRERLAEEILRCFIEPHAAHEVCLAYGTRTRLLARTGMAEDRYLDELKANLISELRLSPVISAALLESPGDDEVAAASAELPRLDKPVKRTSATRDDLR